MPKIEKRTRNKQIGESTPQLDLLIENIYVQTLLQLKSPRDVSIPESPKKIRTSQRLAQRKRKRNTPLLPNDVDPTWEAQPALPSKRQSTRKKKPLPPSNNTIATECLQIGVLARGFATTVTELAKIKEVFIKDRSRTQMLYRKLSTTAGDVIKLRSSIKRDGVRINTLEQDLFASRNQVSRRKKKGTQTSTLSQGLASAVEDVTKVKSSIRKDGSRISTLERDLSSTFTEVIRLKECVSKLTRNKGVSETEKMNRRIKDCEARCFEMSAAFTKTQRDLSATFTEVARLRACVSKCIDINRDVDLTKTVVDFLKDHVNGLTCRIEMLESKSKS